MIIFFTGILSFGQAQEQQAYVGVKFGPNFSTITGDLPDANLTVGLHAGIYSSIRITRNKFALQPEIYYSFQGAKSDSVNYNLNYLQIPLLLKYYTSEYLSVYAGPQVGFLLNNTIKADGMDIQEDQNFNPVDIAFSLGLNYYLGYGFEVGARYNLGLGNIIDEPASDSRASNQVFQVNLAYRFYNIRRVIIKDAIP